RRDLEVQRRIQDGRYSATGDQTRPFGSSKSTRIRRYRFDAYSEFLFHASTLVAGNDPRSESRRVGDRAESVLAVATQFSDFRARKGPIASASIRVRLKQSMASCGAHTIGSFSLKLVLRITGIPVFLSKAWIKS